MLSTQEKFCEVCNKPFERGTAYSSHLRSKAHLKKTNQLNNTNSKKCSKCKKIFLLTGYDSHFRKCKDIRHICETCGEEFETVYTLQNHIEKKHNNNQNKGQETSNQNNNSISDINYQENIGEVDENNPHVESYINHYKQEIKDSIRGALKRFKSVKFSFTLYLSFSKRGEKINPLIVDIRTRYRNLFSYEDNTINLIIEEITTRFEEKLEELNNTGKQRFWRMNHLIFS